MTTTKRRTFSQRHYLAVIRGDFKVLMRYAIHGEPTAPQGRSLVGMSQSQRKRKARELAFFRVKKSVQQAYAAQVETMQARERGEDVANPWDRHYLKHGDAYQQARKDYRVGERLRPCLGCEECRGYDDGIGVLHCDGSGVIPARSRVNRGKPLAVEPAGWPTDEELERHAFWMVRTLSDDGIRVLGAYVAREWKRAGIKVECWPCDQHGNKTRRGA